MKNKRKIAIGGLLTIALACEGLGIFKQIEDGKKEFEKTRVEFPLRIIHSDSFWNAGNLKEARRVYFQIMNTYAENELGYHRPSSGAWMPWQLRDVAERLISKFYNSDAIRNEFVRRDSAGRNELYSLLLRDGY